MAQLFALPKQVPLSSAGALLPGAKLYFYATGTTTAQAVYQDISLTTPHANPVVADAAGVFAPIYMGQFTTDYRVRLETAAGVLIYQLDNIPTGADYAILDRQNIFTGTDGVYGYQIRLSQAVAKLQLNETGATANNRLWEIYASSSRLIISTSLDDESASSDAIAITRSGNNATVVDLKGDSNRSNGVEIATVATGSFTGTLNGYASGPTGTINYNICGGIATLWSASAISGTSNATSLALTGLPAAVQSSVGGLIACSVTDNGNGGIPALASVSAGANTINISILSAGAYSASGFTASGTKGLPAGWLIRYPL